MERQSAIEKIKKLLSVTTDRGATESEALQAALMAQKLVSEYHVEDCELHEKTKDVIKAINSEVVSSRTFALRLSVIVADNFRCQTYHQQRRQGSAIVNEAVFYGYETDALAARLTYQMLYKVGNRLAGKAEREQRKQYGTGSGAYNSFAIGFLQGVQEELEIQSQALMLVVPKEVKEQFQDFSKNMTTCRNRKLSDHAHGANIEAGRRAAHDTIQNHRMKGQLALA